MAGAAPSAPTEWEESEPARDQSEASMAEEAFQAASVMLVAALPLVAAFTAEAAPRVEVMSEAALRPAAAFTAEAGAAVTTKH